MTEIKFNQNTPYSPDLVELDRIISQNGHTIKDLTWSKKDGLVLTTTLNPYKSCIDWVTSQFSEIFNNPILSGWCLRYDGASLGFDLDTTDEQIEQFRKTVQDCFDQYIDEVVLNQPNVPEPICSEDIDSIMTFVWSD